jgi:hypothetical protein
LSELPPINRHIVEANGFKDGRKGRAQFYRLGNDAADISCVVWSDKCHVGKIYRNVFAVAE